MASTRALVFRGFLSLNVLLILYLLGTWLFLSSITYTPTFPTRRNESCTFFASLENNSAKITDENGRNRSARALEMTQDSRDRPVEVSLEEKMFPDLKDCVRKAQDSVYREQGEYWVLENYIPAQVCFQCHESITYTTHAEFTFLDNLEPLVSRWKGPMSIAVYAPGTDFEDAIKVILYLRTCGTDDIRNFVTFHLFFHALHGPKQIPSTEVLLQTKVECSSDPPIWENVPTYRKRYKLIYPINVARNVARQASQTYFVLPSDVELYPALNVIPEFFKMLKRPDFTNTTNPRVYVLPVFEVKKNSKAPENKNELLQMVKKNDAISFHKWVCPECHNVPKAKEWMGTPEGPELSVFHVGKRQPPHRLWEPIYIGTNKEPLYDERLSWEGQKDKMSQMYIMCVQDYEFHILNNAFLVHRPGIKTRKKKPDRHRNRLTAQQYRFIANSLSKEYKKKYGTRKYCVI
ncbi:hypothetical protein SK128_015503 [Halocaridina rubra]|uniref:N-acetyllactosaminide beta-1,3-N-acetylglucosaminyltransferase n=1 Tax=Halocaridina rubra TaxID=373956 RepID=A0AAN8ZUQ6_HALRR